MELSILIWFAVGAGIAAGAFMIARTAVQIASVAYGVMEKRLDPRRATWQTIGLMLVIVVALVATSIIAGISILALFQTIIDNSGTN